MPEILLYLATRCAFLFAPEWYRIAGSMVDASFGGNAMVTLESSVLRLCITRDRGQLLMEFQPLEGKKNEWFSPGLLRGLLEGERGGSEVLDDDWAHFLATALRDLEERLRDPVRREATLDGLRAQARLRAKELFG